MHLCPCGQSVETRFLASRYMGIKSFFALIKSRFLWINVAIAIVAAILIVLISAYSLSRITLHGQQIEVPNLIGLNLEEARVLLQQRDIVLEVIDSIQNRKYNYGEIVEQTPQAKSFVKKGRHIYLIVNARMPRMIPVPDLENMSYRQACATLQSLGFTIGETVYIPSEFSGLVQYLTYNNSRIAAGTRLPDASTISLVVGGEADDENAIRTPNCVGQTYSEAMQQIELNGLVIGAVVTDNNTTPSENDNLLVWKQMPQANELISSGKRVDLWLTNDSARLTPSTQEAEGEEEEFF